MKPIPTIIELRQKLSDDLKSRLNLQDVELKLVLDAMTSTLAAQLKLMYLYLSDVQNNIFPDTADTIEQGGELNRIGNIYINRQPRPATDGVYSVKLIGTAGSQIRAGLTFKSTDDSKNPGMMFIVDEPYELLGVDDFIEVRSLQSGLMSSLDMGDLLSITEPVIGVNKTVEVVEIVALPIESESIESYRRAILNSIQLEPQGGSKTDYRLWANDAQGVRLVYPYVKQNEAGVVQIYVEATLIDSLDGLGTPTAFLLQDVLDVIGFDPDETKPIHERGRRPIQAILEILPINLIPVDVEITGLSNNSVSIQNLIKENLDLYIYKIRPFIPGADLLRNKNDILSISRLQNVVIESIGLDNSFTGFDMIVNNQQENFFTFNNGNIPYLRNVTYL